MLQIIVMILKQRFFTVKETIRSISKEDIVKAQKEENWIKIVKDATKNKNSLDKESISSNSFQLNIRD